MVVIDDSGTPGTPAGSSFLHLNRKSWAAVVVPPHRETDVRQALDVFLHGVAGEFGVRELHFTDIYNGRNQFKNVAIEKRYELFGLMAEIFVGLELPILYQTCSPEFLAEMQRSPSWKTPDVGWFRLDDHEHVGMLFLLTRVRPFLREQRKFIPHPLPVVIDEGLVKAGSAVPMPDWSDLFLGGELRFRKSHDEPLLQLADFAAFSIARMQWILAADQKKPRDEAFIETLDVSRLWLVNLPTVVHVSGLGSREEYEDLLREDRLLKGLPEEPPG